MENIIIKLANAHQNQLRDFDVKREIKSVQEYINSLKLRFDDNTVCLVCLRGYYDDFTKKTNTAFIFINQLGKPIKELHGEIRINVESKEVKFAKTTIDFDEKFIGILQHNEGMLVHIDIPTRGLCSDTLFTTNELNVQFTNVRITYVDEEVIE